MRLIVIISAMFFVLLNSQTAHAESCGLPPVNNVTIPDGKTATRETIRHAVQQVESFSSEMDIYLNCLDNNRDSMLMYMNKEQQARWNEDYANNVEILSTLQTTLNEQIRIFNAGN